MRVIVVLRSEPWLASAAASADAGILANHPLAGLAKLQLDRSFAPIQLPAARDGAFSMSAEETSFVVRGELPADDPQAVLELTARPDVVGVFSDPAIEHTLTCPGAPAVGKASEVADLLAVGELRAAGMTGAGVLLAVVDTGINLAHLSSKGRQQSVDAALSFTPAGVTTAPGTHPVHHGTMCAYDAGIAAPESTLLDHAVLLSQAAGANLMAGLLSDAVRSYGLLLRLMLTPADAPTRLVVSNSWGMFDPSWDFPVGHPGNYSDNPLHPFNILVSSLEAAGADILFAAGNCGRDCPDGRCAFGTSRPICGANSHSSVLSVAGLDTQQLRVGYSSQGPGRLASQKPDVAAYTHFLGSEAFGPGSPDGGTSAACPVAAGVLAAVRSVHSPASLTPAQLRALIQRTARDLGGVGFDHDYGWGVIDVQALLASLPSNGRAHPAPPWPGRFFRFPPLMQGTDVAQWQARMVERGFSLVVDGKYGKHSQSACKDLQGQAGLTVDGVVGPLTWSATWTA